MAETGDLIDERLKVNEITRDQKFSKVWRIQAFDEYEKFKLELDINFDLFQIKVGEYMSFIITESMGNQEEDNGIYNPQSDSINQPKYEKYDYIMCGKIFRIAATPVEDPFQKASDVLLYSCYASFGGLLMKLTAKKEDLAKLKDDSRIYIMVAKD
ncbi:Nucleic acid-binding, OB-fold [Pseudocohnilembus persalinus]|uniref:DNA-directed RNA polymerases I, II, and III subunit RPABC3 n=1 Tax=Pseudocohnilembus persalinus TaxID=266149 RepID=A0A0V0Q8N0_PSEPJ|nr:Nucleic acid-binding, OB-fold [Pseudocohnilembus persalinus]|eukprot:KRW98585.1 Nucleic acid-binding, OB-fold [Pseudocohnilembus persalinus]